MSISKRSLFPLIVTFLLTACSDAPKTAEELAQRLGTAYAAGDFDGVVALFHMNNTNKIGIHEQLVSGLIGPGYKPEIVGDLEMRLLPLPPAIGLPKTNARCPGALQALYNVEVVGFLRVGKNASIPYGRFEGRYYLAAGRDNYGGSRYDRRITFTVEQFEGGEHSLECRFTEAGEQRTHAFSADQAETSFRKKPTLDGERVVITTQYGLCAASIESCQLRRLKGEGDVVLKFRPPERGNKLFEKSSKADTVDYP